jgi:hypothetical protein
MTRDTFDRNIVGDAEPAVDFFQLVKGGPELAAAAFPSCTATDCDKEAQARGVALGGDNFLFRPVDPQADFAEAEACPRAKESPCPPSLS